MGRSGAPRLLAAGWCKTGAGPTQPTWQGRRRLRTCRKSRTHTPGDGQVTLPLQGSKGLSTMRIVKRAAVHSLETSPWWRSAGDTVLWRWRGQRRKLGACSCGPAPVIRLAPWAQSACCSWAWSWVLRYNTCNCACYCSSASHIGGRGAQRRLYRPLPPSAQ